MTTRLRVRRSTDIHELESFLRQHPVSSVYARCDLDEPHFARSHFYLAESGEAVEACLLLYLGDSFQAVLPIGEAEAAGRALEEAPLPERATFIVEAPHLPGLARHYTFDPDPPDRMLRMVVDRRALRRPDIGGVAALGPEDAAEVTAFMRSAGVRAYDPLQLRDGAFRGVRHAGALVSLAGTHVVCAERDVAMIGNVFTLPTHRRRGHALRATAATAAFLLESVSEVGLNVAADNLAAVAVYERLGFRVRAELFEAAAVRRR